MEPLPSHQTYSLVVEIGPEQVVLISGLSLEEARERLAGALRVMQGIYVAVEPVPTLEAPQSV